MIKNTTYKNAVNWCGNSYILQNNIAEIDPAFFDDNADIFCEDAEGNTPEYYQYYISDCTKSDAEWLSKTFNLVFGYSNLLEHYILCVPHYGTGWDYVPCEVKNADWWESNGEDYSYERLTKK